MRAFEQRKKDSPANTSFFSPKIQKKLKTGTVGDHYEVEADKVADKVVNKDFSGGGLLQSKEEVQQKPISETISSVQRKEMKEEEPVQKKTDKKEEEKPVQAKCKDCEKEDKVQKKEEKEKEKEKPIQKKEKNTESEVHDKDIEGKLDNSKGGGTSLDKRTKGEMESGFGNDFSNVKIHTDSNAVQMSQELGAQAFTSGNDVYFNEGKYNPNSKEGKHLLAHELTHTVQQTGMVQKSTLENNPDGIDKIAGPETIGPLDNTLEEQKGGEKKVSCDETVPFHEGPFTSEASAGFFSTPQCPNVTITIDATAQIVQSHNCSSLEISIDHVQRTKKTIQIDRNGNGHFIGTFTMQNHKDIHKLFFTMPGDCKGMNDSFTVSGTIRRHS
ncbi:DUF4157 domain-containing protein [Flavobacterium sp. LS1R49]|uniref:DUF4157 domain-containing protein n=1 Tax=Flavobacterium shii TaxID=2987687 RepID=A0A9X3C054_9FLAO|nr:DUF4157 domain-containing protein [Flavobacterium shii]MCV9930371.1 DUF4157 domain-containing protein [Flavobacterium shii]